jgi:hypothetical protein
MRARIWKIVRGVVFIWGVVSLAGAIGVTALLVYQLGPGNRDKDDSASVRDVRFVLNWCGLGDQRIEKVLHSHVSSRSFTGDHLDAYAIKISHVDLAELPLAADEPHRRWYRGDQLPQVLDETLHLVGGSLHELPWFPREAELRSADFYIYPWGIQLHGTQASAAELVFVRPSDGMVFYFGCKT